MKKALSVVLALVMVISCLALASCGNTTIEDYDPADIYEETRSFKSVYDTIGEEITIDDVIEDPDTGLAKVVHGEKEYELGMDFLSMAMVYNCEPTAKFTTSDAVYAEWWKLYMQRWNYLMPEVPLYSNVYYDFYLNTIEGFQTSPYWGVSSAMVYASMKAGAAESKYIIGSNTDLSGDFRYSAWGVSSPLASNLDIEELTTGLSTVEADQGGQYVWSETVVKSHTETINADGSKTFQITINEGLKFSDGSAVTAKNYLYTTLVFSTPIGSKAMNRDKKAGMYFVGYEEFAAAETSTAFKGIRLIDEYTFSVTVDEEYIPYYYDITYAGFTPTHQKLWMNTNNIADDGQGVYITEGFYAKTGDNFNMVAHLTASRKANSTAIPFSGPYVISSYDESAKQATLKINPNFAGNFEGQKPSIETLVYVKIITETQLQQMKDGLVNILAGLSGGPGINEALALVKETGDKYAYCFYNRAGYGKLGFRCDFGPISYTEVRQAVSYVIDKDDFCKQFTSGYGVVVYGAYCEDQWMYQANKNKIKLNSYEVNTSKAISVLEKGGWIYDAKGGKYETGDGVRYKKISGTELTENNLKYQSVDGAYKTIKINGEYYMPLVINWYCSEDNEVSELLKTTWAKNSRVSDVGMAVQYTQGTFPALIAELTQDEGNGYTGPAKYVAFNFGTGFTSAVYDYSFGYTLDPDMYDLYQQYYLPDAADYVWGE